MAPLRNGRWERFALEVVKGSSAKAAMEAAGYKDRRNCTRLLKTPSIAKRISELRDTAAERTTVTLELLLEKVEEARQLAMASGQPGAAVAAIREIGVLSGLRVEKRDVRHRVATELSDEELLRIAAGG